MNSGLLIILSYHGPAASRSLVPNKRSVGTCVAGVVCLLRAFRSKYKTANMF